MAVATMGRKRPSGLKRNSALPEIPGTAGFVFCG